MYWYSGWIECYEMDNMQIEQWFVWFVFISNKKLISLQIQTLSVNAIVFITVLMFMVSQSYEHFCR